MKSIFIAAIFLLSSASFAAKNNISSELLTVKACHEEMVRDYAFDLSDVTEVAVTDTGRNMEVRLTYVTKSKETCNNSHWFAYDGTISTCPQCLDDNDNPSCSCVSGLCSIIVPEKP